MLIYIDCGAYNGDTVQQALEWFPAVDVVYAIEPHPDNFAKLQARCRNDHRVHFIPRAVSASATDTTTLRLSNDGTGHSLLKKKNCHHGTLSILNMRLSDLLLRYNAPCPKGAPFIMLKLDIEGAEYQVIPELVERQALVCVTRIWVEWHKKRVGVSMKEHRRVVDMLNQYGYGLTGENRYDEFSREARNRQARH